MGEPRRPTANRLLGALSISAFIIAAIGLLLDRNATLAGGFLAVALVLAVVAVFEPRMEGQQRVGLSGATLNLASVEQVIAAAEVEVSSGALRSIEEVK